MSQPTSAPDPCAASSRRHFLSHTPLAAAGAVLAAPAVPAVHAAGDETIKVALIGCGGRGTGAATQALSTPGPVKLWAMADVFEDKLQSSYEALVKGQEARYDRKEHGGFADRVDVPPERRFIGFDSYKQAIDSGVDLVILTTFPHFRPAHFEYAVQQGKHVFMEKPVAVDAAGVRRILAANETARQKDLKVGVGLQRHHQRVYEETMGRLADGAIGQPQLLRVYWNAAMPAKLGPRENMTEMEFQFRYRYFFTWLVGDHIVEQHVHNIDVGTWVMGGAHPVEANGMGGRQYRNGREHGEIFDHHAVEFTYADGTRMYSFCRHIPQCWNSVSEHVLGTKGSAQIDRGIIESAGSSWRFRGESPNPYQVEHDRLFEAVRRDTPFNEAEYGAISTMTGILGRMATYSGQAVKWDDAIASQETLAPDRYSWDATPPVVPDADGVYPCAVPGVTKPV